MSIKVPRLPGELGHTGWSVSMHFSIGNRPLPVCVGSAGTRGNRATAANAAKSTVLFSRRRLGRTRWGWVGVADVLKLLGSARRTGSRAGAEAGLPSTR